jgi:hypothetical protein
LSAFTTAKGRLSMNAMFERGLEVVDGDGRGQRWQRWQQELYLVVRHNVPRLGTLRRTYGLRRIGNFEKGDPIEHHQAAC